MIGQVMMASHLVMKVEGNYAHQPEGELVFDNMAQQVQNLFIFKNFYEQMDFSTDQHLAITEAIIKLANSLWSHALLSEGHVEEFDLMTMP